jgi:hypothetical protein
VDVSPKFESEAFDLEKVKENICQPEGTFLFDYSSPELFNAMNAGGIIIEVPSGQHYFRVDRDQNMMLNFYHSSPGTGTRRASISLRDLEPVEEVMIGCVWSPEEIKLHVKPRTDDANSDAEKMLTAVGSVSQRQYKVGKDGGVYQIGDDGVEVGNVRIYMAGKPIIQPTAIEAWRETIKAIELLETGTSSEGYMYEVVVSNLTLTVLVTGFEAYLKNRFLELEQEGISSDVNAIIKEFYPKEEIMIGIERMLELEAKNEGKSLLEHVVGKGVINFQNYKKAKAAFNKGYSVKFGELEVSSYVLTDLQRYIRYRHKIVHVSASLSMLNQEKSPPDEPVHSKKEMAFEAKCCFCEFIEALHRATLHLRP